jgi:NTE family protein
MRKGKTVSLVLGSGGARGLAHIGIIEWLTENGFIIRSIAGSSMGALIGGIFAAGKLDVYKQWVSGLSKADVVRLLDPSFGWTGLFKGDRVIGKLRELIGDRNIEDLPISFTAVATDIEEQKEVWITQGPLFDAIRASIAVPMVFTPFKLDGRRLVDGAIINPVPIAPTLADRTDLTIAVNVNGRPDEAFVPASAPEKSPKKPVAASGQTGYASRIRNLAGQLADRLTPQREQEWDLFDIMTLSLDTMQNAIARMKLAAYSPDVIITLSCESAGSYEFYRAQELIALGREAAQATLSPLLSRQ